MPCPARDPAALLKDSFPAIYQAKARIGAAAYRHLFERAPELRPLFSGAFSARHQMMVEELALMLRAAETGEPLPKAARLGLFHASLGVEAAHFPLMREALLAAMAEEMGPGFCPGARAAWAEAFDRLAGQMQADIPPPPGTAPRPPRP
ncbi:globin domain-containing protein [Poseidonocella sp. HB161398]|uniref:globin domain-containing protein n=1 Tax=Poseidonocella sp. HB161398 TaxID=2320855 RepID=UPI001485EDE0|nr:globin domain-containing protein [Poseidonocella sp. HB161398]